MSRSSTCTSSARGWRTASSGSSTARSSVGSGRGAGGSAAWRQVVGGRHVEDGHVGHGALGQAGEHPPGPDLDERGRPRGRRACAATPASARARPGGGRAGRASRRGRRGRGRRCWPRPASAGSRKVRPSRQWAPRLGGGVGQQRGVEGVADVERHAPVRTPAAGPARPAASTPSGVPAITTWPGALSLATHTSVPPRAHARRRRRRRCPSAPPCARAGRRPTRWLAARPGGRPAGTRRRGRRRRRRARAVIWPSEWPAKATGGSSSGAPARPPRPRAR